MHERRAGERGGFDSEVAIEGEAPAVEQTHGKIGQTPLAQVDFFTRSKLTNLPLVNYLNLINYLNLKLFMTLSEIFFLDLIKIFQLKTEKIK